METTQYLQTIYMEVAEGHLAGVVRRGDSYFRVVGEQLGSESFRWGDILAVLTGDTRFTGDGRAGLKRVLSYMTRTPWDDYGNLGGMSGEEETDQRARCRDWILLQYPSLKGLKVPSDEDKGWIFISQLKGIYGKRLVILPLSAAPDPVLANTLIKLGLLDVVS